MKVKILFRKSLAEENEYEIASKYFDVIDSRALVEQGDLVIGRYSVLPYYKELEDDVNNLGAYMVNSYKQHQYVANISNWYYDLEDLTPKTWFFDPSYVPESQTGSFILKGDVNSRKQLFKTHFFAKTRKDIMDVYCRLLDDSLIQHQGIVIRQFEELVNYGEDSITGCPISKEFRFFVYEGKIISGGYYWSQHYDDIEIKPSVDEVPKSFLNEIVNRIEDMCSFYCFDVAQKINGEWILIELGDGQMAGLSCIEPHLLYNNLKKEMNHEQQI